MIQLEDIRRIDLGYVVRPAEETATGTARVEPCLGYLLRLPDGLLILDTGIGEHPDVDAHYRPSRRPLVSALADADVALGDIRQVVNCHLHFDHCGGNPELSGRPIYVQATELEQARTERNYTIPQLIDVAGARYEQLDGEAQITPGVWLIPTPGHTRGHQSLVVRCDDGTVVLAGQAHDHAAAFTWDQLAWRAREEGATGPLPPYPEWIARLMSFDPRRICFAHDLAVWEPPR